MRHIDEIIIHCSATRQGVDFTAADIDRWHKQRGFKKIGYHYVIRLDGTVETGRKLDEVGAHCLNHNKHSIGICYIGGLDQYDRPCDTRTPEQKASMYRLLLDLIIRYPNVTLHGHREFANKACPCFDVQSEYFNINLPAL